MTGTRPGEWICGDPEGLGPNLLFYKDIRRVEVQNEEEITSINHIVWPQEELEDVAN